MDLAKTVSDPEAAALATWSQPEAFLGVLLLVAVSDVQKHTTRLRAVEEYARRSPLLRPLGEKGRSALHCSAAHHLGAEDALTQACAVVAPAMGPSLYAQALDLIIEAEAPSVQEEALMARLAALLHVDAVTAARIREIITLKNKY
jgi:hypothetical protein